MIPDVDRYDRHRVVFVQDNLKPVRKSVLFVFDIQLAVRGDRESANQHRNHGKSFHNKPPEIEF
jgi:hypothetical protein